VTSIELNGLTLSYSLTCRYQSKGLLERFLARIISQERVCFNEKWKTI